MSLLDDYYNAKGEEAKSDIVRSLQNEAPYGFYWSLGGELSLQVFDGYLTIEELDSFCRHLCKLFGYKIK